MADQPWPRLLGGLLLVLYPLLVYIGLQYVDWRWLLLLLVAAGALRLVGTRRFGVMPLAMAAAVMIAVLVSLWHNSELGLLLYPVLINAGLLCLFLASWVWPPTIIERLARLKDPHLPAAAISYTRKLTLVWAGFFLVNGSLAAVTIGLSREIWTLYNGLIAYILIGALLGGEWVLRKKRMEQHRA